ncbi:MAG: Hpt domain-containing protein [Acidimicrobiia bacterium]
MASGSVPSALAEVDRARIAALRRACAAPGALEEVVSDFVDSGIERLEGLRSALAAGDAGAVVQVAHVLAGSSAMIGLPALARLAGELESRVRAGGLERAPALTAALVASFPRAVRSLRQAIGDRAQ